MANVTTDRGQDQARLSAADEQLLRELTERVPLRTDLQPSGSGEGMPAATTGSRIAHDTD